jgi:hypothetical protein
VAAAHPAGPAPSLADRLAEAAPVKWLVRLLLPANIMADLQRDMARIVWAQTEILIRLRKIQEQLDRLVDSKENP